MTTLDKTDISNLRALDQLCNDVALPGCDEISTLWDTVQYKLASTADTDPVIAMWAIGALAVAATAKIHGRSFWGWFLLGMFATPVVSTIALIIVMARKPAKQDDEPAPAPAPTKPRRSARVEPTFHVKHPPPQVPQSPAVRIRFGNPPPVARRQAS